MHNYSYVRAQDASLVMDICRQSLIFDDPREVAACLRAVAADPAVAILRVKNRLSHAYDSRRSAGYRDVALNLRLDTPETRRLGLAHHVCEVREAKRGASEASNRGRCRRFPRP